MQLLEMARRELLSSTQPVTDHQVPQEVNGVPSGPTIGLPRLVQMLDCFHTTSLV